MLLGKKTTKKEQKLFRKLVKGDSPERKELNLQVKTTHQEKYNDFHQDQDPHVF